MSILLTLIACHTLNHLSFIGSSNIVALAALGGEKTLAQLTQKFEVHQHQIIDWKKQLPERAIEIVSKRQPPPVDLQALRANIGQFMLEIDFLLVPFG